MSLLEDRSSDAAEDAAPVEHRFAWHESAPKSISAASDWQDDGAGWKAWRNHLAKRKRPLSLARLLNSDGCPLLWGWPKSTDAPATSSEPDADQPVDGDLESTVRRLLTPDEVRAEPQWLQNEAARWHAEIAEDPQSPSLAIKSLAWCHALPTAAAVLPSVDWWEMLGELLTLAWEAGAGATTGGLSWQLLAGELPLTMAYQFPELDTCRRLAPGATATVAVGIAELLDGKGMPKFEHLGQFRAWLACWTRARAIGETLNGSWKKKPTEEFDRLVRHGLRLSRHDGSPVFGERTEQSANDVELFRFASRFNPENRTIAAAVLGKESLELRRGKFPNAATHSEWSEIGLLRADWSKTSPRFTVGYAQRKLAAELDCGREVLWSGVCDPQLNVNGSPLAQTSDWAEVCWISDKDVDYLELEATFNETIRVQRQMLLAREDRFLIHADAVLAQAPTDMEYRCELPLAPGVRFEAADETREGRLIGRKARAVVMPLALSEWRHDPSGGSLEVDAQGRLVLRQSVQAGRALFAPLFVDLDRRRLERKLTWRRLTVAENRQNQPLDRAAGYRVQIGGEQWLIYRSLTGPANRTVLGHHLLTQFITGRFNLKGEVQSLLEIE